MASWVAHRSCFRDVIGTHASSTRASTKSCTSFCFFSLFFSLFFSSTKPKLTKEIQVCLADDDPALPTRILPSQNNTQKPTRNHSPLTQGANTMPLQRDSFSSFVFLFVPLFSCSVRPSRSRRQKHTLERTHPRLYDTNDPLSLVYVAPLRPHADVHHILSSQLPHMHGKFWYNGFQKPDFLSACTLSGHSAA